MRSLLLVLLLTFFPLGCWADEATLAAWKDLGIRRSEAEQVNHLARQEASKEQDPVKKLQILNDADCRSHDVVVAAETAFRVAFAKSEWDSWNSERDADLIEEGLNLVAGSAMKDDPATSVRALELLLAKLPKCASARFVHTDLLPAALTAAGRFFDVESRLAKMREGVSEEEQVDLWIVTGDSCAARNDWEGAQAAWVEAARLHHDLDQKRETPTGHANPRISLRQSLLGKAPPGLDSKTWVGGVARPLSSFKGQVVLLDFWEPCSLPSLREIPAFRDMKATYKDSEFAMLGITRYGQEGFLPKDAGELLNTVMRGDFVATPDKDSFLKQIGRFRDAAKVPFPTVVAEKSDFENFGVAEPPMRVLVDSRWKVRFILDGDRPDALLRMAVRMSLVEMPPKSK